MSQATELPEIEMPVGSIVIADLHLDLSDPEGGTVFAAWLRRRRGVPLLVVLGDLFDVWVGPAQMGLVGASRVLEALSELTRGGTRLVVVHGNRDFLLDASFESATGARVLPDGFVGLVANRGGAHDRILFVHGDTLCTLDHGYQRLRRVLRSSFVRGIAPRLPLAIGTSLTRRLRRASVHAVARKYPAEKSIQPDAVVAAAHAARASVLVCGHAHEFRDERIEDVRWIVLDAFGGIRDAYEVRTEGAHA